MAGSFSGHLVNSFLQAQPPRGPFGQPLPLQISTCGPMSFAPSMHGAFNSFSNATQTSMSTMSFVEPSFMDLSEESAKKIAALQAKLDKKLGPEYISQRPGPGGGPKLTYAEGWKIINLANEVFGFNGWSSNVVSLTTDFIDQNEQSQRYTVGVTAIVRVTLRDGVFHEDIGYGMLENSKSKGGALDKCKKEAVTDAIKRALRNFGNLLGNCLYDKQYAQEVVKIKVPPPKFDKDNLHRRPEFEERKPDINALASAQAGPSHNAAGPSWSTSKPEQATTANNAPRQQASKPPSSVPPHMRAANTMNPSTNYSGKGKSPMGLAEHTTPARPNNMPPPKLGLVTPEQTPVHPAPAQRTNTSTSSGVVYKQPAPPKPPLPPLRSASTTAPSKQAESRPPIKTELTSAVDSSVDVNVDVDPLLRTESVEEYGLNSDDDAFFAAVDLGEGDSGIGGHIDFDEGSGAAMEGEASLEQEPELSPQALDAVRSHPAPAMHARFNPTTLKPQQQAGQLGQQRIQDRGVAQVNAQAGQSSTSSRAVNPNRTQSMGGFHFPPGYNSKPAQSSSSVAGAKRPADHTSNSNLRRPVQGMGLSHQPQPGINSNGKREPLAQLDIGEGGDPKRMRR